MEEGGKSEGRRKEGGMEEEEKRESEKGRGREGKTHCADLAVICPDSEGQLQSYLYQTFSLFGSDVFQMA